MTLLRLWLIGSGGLLAGAMAWAFAPILVLVAVVLVGLGGLVLGIVSAARALERWRSLPPPRS